MRLDGVGLKQKLKQGGVTIGSWLSFGYTPVCEMMAKAGFEWLVIDMEHTAIDTWQMFQMIQIIDQHGVSPLVRVGANDPLLIKRALDAGAHGVVVPMVNTAEEARAAVAAALYPPHGKRGVGLSRAQGYGISFPDYKAWAEENIVVIVQIEHIEAVHNLGDILAVEGVDGFIVGPYDLSGSVGHPGDFQHPEVRAAMAEVQITVGEGLVCGGFHVVQSNREALADRIKEGYRFLAYGDDMVFLAEKLEGESRFLAELKQSSTRSSS